VAHDVFVSYPNVDKPTADAVVNALESEGIRCWVAPRDVLHGQDWAGAIVEAIASAKMLVLVFSDGTNQSDHILREVRAAGDAGLPILPLRTTDVEPTAALKYYIGGMHWLDAMSGLMERHLDELVATARRVMAGEGQAAAPATPAPTRGAWWRRGPVWGWVVSSVAGAALIVGAASVFGGSPEGTSVTSEDTLPATVTEATAASSSTPSSEPESSTPTVDTTPDATTTTIVVPELEWALVDDPDLSSPPDTITIDALAYDGARFVAIGGGSSRHYWEEITVWSSTGGTEWSVVASGNDAFGSDDVVVHDVVAAGPRFVAVGADRSGDDTDAAVWTSPDGSSWTRQAADTLRFLDDQEMYAVASDGSRIIAVGTDFDGTTADPAIWSSEDGLQWSRLSFGEPGSDWREMRTIAVFDGLWVATDGERSGADMMVWRSTDGEEWTRASTDEISMTGPGTYRQVHGMSAGRDGFIAVGSAETLADGTGALMWMSGDGLAWTHVPITVDTGTHDFGMLDVQLAGARLLIAVGYEIVNPDPFDQAPRIWIATLDG
jgi:hypothetical protein